MADDIEDGRPDKNKQSNSNNQQNYYLKIHGF